MTETKWEQKKYHRKPGLGFPSIIQKRFQRGNKQKRGDADVKPLTKNGAWEKKVQ